jgi:hypothetical protein
MHDHPAQPPKHLHCALPVHWRCACMVRADKVATGGACMITWLSLPAPHCVLSML